MLKERKIKKRLIAAEKASKAKKAVGLAVSAFGLYEYNKAMNQSEDSDKEEEKQTNE